MSYKFIKDGYNNSDLQKAKRQQKQINHLTISEVQEDITTEYLSTWADRNYITDDYLLNFVKTIFKTDNFLAFYKYLRYPLCSSTLVNETIIPELERVFHSDDAYFEYSINGETVKEINDLDCECFYKDVFKWLMFRFNDVIVVQPNDEGGVDRYPVCIDRVCSINYQDGKIKQIAYTGFIDYEGEEHEGKIYIDDEVYAFYKQGEEIPLYTVEHELGKCPVDFVSPIEFNPNKSGVIRYSIFSKVREKLEEYVFLKTLQRMTEPNGAIPVVTKLKTKDISDNNEAGGNSPERDTPMSSRLVGGQRAELNKEVNGKGSIMQAGTIIDVPKIMKEDGSLDMDAVQNFIKTFYLPVESLEYLSKRIKEIEQAILRIVVGDYAEANEAAKNEKQVSKSYVSKQDKLRRISEMLTKTVGSSDYKALGLIYGKDNVEVDVFFGSDFFIESKQDIYDMIKSSPNPIETKNLLVRLSNVNNKFNKMRATREKILYLLLPYANNEDFIIANEKELVSREIFDLQTRFNYWIGMFEANYGNIAVFWQDMEEDESTKLIAINQLIFNLIINSYGEEQED